MATQASVLIVDGNPQMTAMLQRFLTQHQVDTQAVLSAGEARALLAQHAFRVVVTDRFTPLDEGLDVLRYVRQTVPATRVILMTAFGAPAFHRQALAEGAYACLAKPFRLRDFWEVLQPAL
jgi:two-component system NtrC family response regulator